LRKILFAVALFVLAVPGGLLAQTVKNLKNPAPDGVIVPYLLTDGRVLGQGGNGNDFWTLTPDINGSYLNGTWKQVASLPSGYDPYAQAAAVLADGRVLQIGGEYNFGNFDLTNLCAVYDPAANTWAKLAAPDGWDYIGDSPSTVLPDGTFLLGQKITKKMALLDPKTLTWTAMGSKGKADFNAEEGWTLMPDGTVLTYDVKKAPNAEKYLPNKQKWVNASNTIVDLHQPYEGGGCLDYGGPKLYCPPGEVGPGILRPDGTVFATGAVPTGSNTAHTAVYHPGKNPADPGSWTVGPDFPSGDAAGDDFAALLTNGRVLVEGNSGRLYEFDGTKLSSGPFGGGSLLVLPTGEVLIGGEQLYTSTGTYKPGWAPKILTFPASVTRGTTYTITGKRFNGLSQAAAFGDEFETATNYPLVRITNVASGHVFYAKTHGHSSMGVATGNLKVSTNFDVPAGMETGASTLEVVANGIPSPSVSITVN